MRLARLTIVVSLFWIASGVARPGQPLLIRAGEAFSLRHGQSAQTSDGVFRVGFEGVSADSRCAKGEQCVWAGDAVVQIWLQRGSRPREMHELHTAQGAAKAANDRSHEVRLVRLDPISIAGTAIAKRDYVATLTLTLGPAGDPER